MSNTIYTHSGLFHGDDVFAVAIARLAGFGPTVERVRELPDSFSPEEGDIAVDIGGQFAPDGGIFDHHHEDAAQGNQLAAAGRIWEKFGLRLCGGDSRVAERVYETLIGSIDRADLGLLDWQPSGYESWRHLSASAMIAAMNPPVSAPPEAAKEVFDLAVACAISALSGAIAQAEAYFEMKDAVYAAATTEGQKVLVLPKAGPWQEHLLKDPKLDSVLYVIYPSERGGWCVQCVPDAIGSFGKRKALPREWGGLRGETLSEMLELDGVGKFTPTQALFCHPGLFIAGAETREEALVMAKVAINA